jgi:hypothetical protein
MISTMDDESESESISIGVCLEFTSPKRGGVGVSGGGESRKVGLFGIGRKLVKGLTTLAGGAADDVSTGGTMLSSLLDAVFLSEVDISRKV